MSKTVPTYSEVVEEKLRRWKKFENALRGKDRKIFEKIKNYAKLNRPSGMTMASPNPLQANDIVGTVGTTEGD